MRFDMQPREELHSPMKLQNQPQLPISIRKRLEVNGQKVNKREENIVIPDINTPATDTPAKGADVLNKHKLKISL